MQTARLRDVCRSLIVSLCIVQPTMVSGSEVPGWFLAGSSPDKYRIALESGVAYNGSHSASLSSRDDAALSEFGTLMQHVAAGQFVGKRVRFSAFVRTKDVSGGAALWMRVDGNGITLEFDNMSHRGWIRGDSPWTRYSIVLDVPPKVESVSFGLMLTGNGVAWIDDATLKPVSPYVTKTAMVIPAWRSATGHEDFPPVPRNLDFEDEPGTEPPTP